MNIAIASSVLRGAMGSTAPTSAETLTRPEKTTGIMMQALTAAVSYTLDGSDPSGGAAFSLLVTQGMVNIPLPENGVVKVYSATGTVVYQWYGA